MQPGISSKPLGFQSSTSTLASKRYFYGDFQGGVSYVSKDGDYIFTGSLFHVKGKDVVNTTEQAILMGVREFASKTKSIDYKLPNEKYRLAIFTDITCGYCQKLHHDLKV